MALEWVLIGYVGAAEATMLLLLTLPLPDALRHRLAAVCRGLLKPFLAVVPYSLFLLMDIYWKLETRPSCTTGDNCSPTDYLRHQKSAIKIERNALLIAVALILYWLLFSMTSLILRVHRLNQQVEKLKNQE
ncbi:hypothetical protein RJ641_012130 [Dillenia turbinata]|uniref:Endoplasmic reticulum transmembrane protein n=1 Tax=Dillenia turbinata TaxID=194707 RepID=A0AAN8UR27_9MAGN